MSPPISPPPPPPPPKGISSQPIDKPGYASRLIATQQPDTALRLTNIARWSLCTCKGG